MDLNAGDLELKREELEMERSSLQQQILDMELKMDKMYTHILRQRKRPYEHSREDDELLTVSVQNDALIARYYTLVEQIRELDIRMGRKG